MAASVPKLTEVVFEDAHSTVKYQVMLPEAVKTLLETDQDAARIFFCELEEDFPMTSGKKCIGVSESLKLILKLGLTSDWTRQARGNGVSLGRSAVFDPISQAATREDLPDTLLASLGKNLPKGLTAGEQVRFLELAVASIPNGTSDSTNNNNEEEGGPSTSRTGTSDSSNIIEEEQGSSCNSFDTTPNPAPESVEPDNERIFWTHEAVLLLISLKEENAHLFESNVVTSKQAWKKIAEEMVKKGHNFTADDINRKFRNLKMRHRKLKDEKKKTGRGRKAWRYFDLMEKHFEGDPAVQPVAAVGSLIPAKSATSTKTATPVHTSTACATATATNTMSGRTPATASVATTTTAIPNRAAAPTTDTTHQVEAATTSTNRRKRSSSDHLYLQLREDFLKMHNERMELENKKVKVLEKIVNLLQSRNDS